MTHLKSGARYPFGVRKLIFPLYIATALALALAVCWVLWKQHLEQEKMNQAAREIAAGLANALDSYEKEDPHFYLPGSLDELGGLDPEWQRPASPLNGKPVKEVPLFQNTEAFDVTYLRGKSSTVYLSSAGPENGVWVEEDKAVVILVYGPPGYKGKDVDGDSLPDPIIAYYPFQEINTEYWVASKPQGAHGIVERRAEALELTVRRERDRLRDENRKAAATETPAKEH